MKTKPKNTLSPLQRRRLVNILVLLGCLAAAWVLFAPDMGILAVRKERARLEQLQEKKALLERQNRALREEIERIETDVEYFEKLAREKFGLLKKNETVFDFSKDQKKDDQ